MHKNLMFFKKNKFKKFDFLATKQRLGLELCYAGSGYPEHAIIVIFALIRKQTYVLLNLCVYKFFNAVCNASSPFDVCKKVCTTESDRFSPHVNC